VVDEEEDEEEEDCPRGREGRLRGEEGWSEEDDVGRDNVNITNLVKKRRD